MMGGPFGSENLVPTPPRGPRGGHWKFIVLAIVCALLLALAIGGPALAHSMEHMAGGCGGG